MVAFSESLRGLLKEGAVMVRRQGWRRVVLWRRMRLGAATMAPALQPTVYVPLRRCENLTYEEMVARKV